MNTQISLTSLTYVRAIILALACITCGQASALTYKANPWIVIDNFESPNAIQHWTNVDVQNETSPFVENPQITVINSELKHKKNHYLLRKPALEGIIGNRKAISFTPLPIHVEVGETFTFFTRINVEYFPNNHSFGLSNLTAENIKTENYNAFEPMIRITDKKESDGTQNDGTLMVLSGEYKQYKNIINPETGNSASPLLKGQWYDLWYVVNNSPREKGGQRYDLYVKGGEFTKQQLVFKNADFRMKREQALTYFMAICNTGSKQTPYGNGGVKYDDIYMTSGLKLTSPNE